MNIPCWLYHKELGAKLFNSRAEIESLDDGWVDTPAHFEDAIEDEVLADHNESSDEPVILSAEVLVDLPEKPVKKAKAVKKSKK